MGQAAQAGLIEQTPFNRTQLLIVTLCGATLFMDGFDAQAMGYVAPALAPELHIARQALGPVFSSGLVGIMIGALLFGPLADRIGRRPVLILCTVLFGVCSLLTAKADSLTSLLVYRLITGLGLGGALPNAIALTAEYAPKRLRATAVTAMFCGFSIGAAVGGFVAAGLISRYGWQSVFIAGGVTPLFVAVLLMTLLAESGEFRRSRDGSSVLVPKLFGNGRARMTVLFWIIFFMSLLDLYFLNNWLPTVIHDSGIAVERAIILTALFQVGGTVGALLLGRLIDRYLSARVLAWTYLGAGVCVALIGLAGKSTALLGCAISAAGFLVVGGQSGANALAAEYYPTALRSTGVGWALGIGRVGSIVGPLLGGILISLEPATSRLFLVASGPVLLAAAAAFLAGRGGFREDRSV
ncbi:MAG TPA: MFS transporter [Bryobacteraceae bacterium]|nr:MFS transporter [Bryobacteraceae bacterium]